MKLLESERQKQLAKFTSDYELLKGNVEEQVTKFGFKSENMQKRVDTFRQEMLNYRMNFFIFFNLERDFLDSKKAVLNEYESAIAKINGNK